MATQGPNFPSTAANDATVGTLTWTNVTNVVADDGSYATNSTSAIAQTEYAYASGFGFAIPASATIVGVTAVTNGHYTFSGSSFSHTNRTILFSTAGTTLGSAKTSPEPLNNGNLDADATFGSGADTWGAALTPTIVNSSGFGLGISMNVTAITGTVSLFYDSVKITITYNDPSKSVSDALTCTESVTVKIFKNIAAGENLTCTESTTVQILSFASVSDALTMGEGPFTSGSVSSGPLSPGTTANDASIGTTAWVDPNNAQVSDAVYATINTPSTISQYLKATNFGFAIPIGSKILGILAEVQRKSAFADAASDNSVVIVKSSGAFGTTNKAFAGSWGSTESYHSYGSSADLWGETWAAEDINNSNFGFAIAANDIGDTGTDGSIDHMRITVTYAPPTGPNVQTVDNVSAVEILTVSESLTKLTTLFVSISDSLTCTESVTVLVSTLIFSISVSDALTVTESRSQSIGGPDYTIDIEGVFVWGPRII